MRDFHHALSVRVRYRTVLIGTIVLEWSGTVPVTYVRTNRTVYILFYFVQNMCIILFECTVITYVSRIWFKNICKQSFVIVINDLVITYVRTYVRMFFRKFSFLFPRLLFFCKLDFWLLNVHQDRRCVQTIKKSSF